MRTFLRYGVILGLTLIYSTTAMSQQKQPTRKNLLNAVVNQKVSIVEIKEVTMIEGQAVPKHLHPCPVVGYVKSGKVLFQIEGEEKIILNEGDAFYEPKNKNILHFDNASNDKPLTFVAFYLKEANEDNIKIIED